MPTKKSNSFFNPGDNTISFTGSFVTEMPGKDEQGKICFREKGIFLLPLFNNVVFPLIPQPVKIVNEIMGNAMHEAFEKGLEVFAVQVKEGIQNPEKTEDFHSLGIVAKVVKIINLPGEEALAFITGFKRARLQKVYPLNNFLYCDIKVVADIKIPKKFSPELELMSGEIDKVYNHSLNFIPEMDRENIKLALDGVSDRIDRKIYSMALNSPISVAEKQSILECNTLLQLMESFLRLMNYSIQKLELQASIHMRTHEELSMQQKETFLKQQLKYIREELGGDPAFTDEDNLRELAKDKKWPKEVEAHFEKELKKLERFNPQSPDYSVQYGYLETMLSLPWNNMSGSTFSLSKVEKILDRDHYGMEKVKDRIIEQMAVIKLRNDLKAPILCLYGPPGVGKTSLGKSVAEALGREYVRIALGGLKDESEIRGHRKTYIGAMPGRIIGSLQKCSTGDPVVVLDEIDKIGNDYKGDPSTALLEVLDPEQNSTFHDNYLDIDYDLSKILFLATANDLSTISRPLLDRMEIIEIGGYIPEEKIEIALRHLIPKSLEETGFQKKEVSFSKTALSYLIHNYTRESGVRQLEKKIKTLLRKIARLKVSSKPFPKNVTPDIIKNLLGKEEVSTEAYEDNSFAGVVTGLAWTQSGGEILFIESSLSPGNGEKLTLTGNLGDVMKESATIALQYLKANAEELGIDQQWFTKYNLHIHVPEGAIPKDGPSAGITMATSIASAFTGRAVREKTAMTGEITLRGKVLPVGGIKEKILAAKRAGITDIILSEKNRKDIDEVNPKYLKGLDFHFVNNIREVFDFALLPQEAIHKFNLK